MQAFFQFIGPWGSYVAFSGASLAILLWLWSHDQDPNDGAAASAFLWSIFWPIRWLYMRLVGKDGSSSGFHSRRRRPSVFKTIREAKDYLANSIGEEAQRAGIRLTEVERKMLYFSETGWTLPDMKKVSAEFDRKYDQNDYERKIRELVTKMQVRLAAQGEQEQERWSAALEKLSRGDHYLLVLTDAASPTQRGLRHNFKLLVIAFALLAYVALDMYFRRWMRDH